MKGGGINFSKGRIFLISCLSFILGNFFISFLLPSFSNYIFVWFSLFTFFFFLILIFWNKIFLRVLFIVFFFFFFSFFNYSQAIKNQKPTSSDIWFYNEKTVEFFGVIIEPPENLNVKSRFKVKALGFSNNSQKLFGLVLVSVNPYPRYNYGDKLKIKCRLVKPEKINDFSYDKYLARYNIFSLCYYPKIEKIGYQKNWFYSQLFKIKEIIKNRIEIGLPEPLSSLASPVVLGGNQGLSDEYKQMFSDLGLTHIMAVSGFNISIIASIVMSCLLFLGLSRKQAFYFSIIFLGLYVLLVGLPASALRAGLMGSLVLLAIHLSRLNKIINALSFTASLMILINPLLLRDDVGFQLSFLAILGLVYYQSIFDNLLDKLKIPKLKGLREAFSTTLAAQVFTLPILAINFKKISLISPISNMLIVPIISLLTILILAAIFLAMILPFLAKLFFLPSFIILKYIFIVVEFLNKTPFKVIEVDSFSWSYVLIYYIIVSGLVIFLKKLKNYY
jgi:competence protein ComEC